MSGERFTIDTNVLIYGFNNQSGNRRDCAKEIIRLAIEANCCLTLQALSEFYFATTRKGMMPRSVAASQVDDWLDMFPTVTANAAAIRVAIADATIGRASYWDALLVATAAEAGCTAILTEDMAGGTCLGPVRIINPFTFRGGMSEEAKQLLALE